MMLFVATLALCTSTSLQGPATDYYVSATAGSDANDGLTPTTAWRTISNALASVPQAVAGASALTIHVGPGTYDAALGEAFPLEASDLAGNLATPIEIVSDSGSAATTIQGTNAPIFLLEHNFMGFDTDETRIERIEGFTLRGGSTAVRMDAFGGSALTTTLRDLDIAGQNTGVAAIGVGDNTLAVGGVVIAQLENVRVDQCTTGVEVNSGGQGAGTADVALLDCAVTTCTDGIVVSGASTSVARLVRCFVASCGTGARVEAGSFGISLLRAERSVFDANGSGIRTDDLGRALAVLCELDRCTLARNFVGYSNFLTSPIGTLESCIVAGNGGDFVGAPPAIVRYTASSSNPTGDSTNLVADPLFVDVVAGDLSLQADSPCVDAGDPAAPADPDGSRADMGALPLDQSVGIPFCTGKVNSLGCVPFVSTAGSASASSAQPFQFQAEDVVPGTSGIVVYSLQAANLSFHGGKLCVKSPVTRLVPPKLAKSSGAPPCSGVLQRDLNTRIQSGADPLLTTGQTVHAQWYYRDPADPAGFADGLTNGLRFSIAP